MDMDYEESVWWPTPVLIIRRRDPAALNARLKQIILQKEQEIGVKQEPTAVAGISEGMTANWLRYNVLNWAYPEVATLREMVLAGARRFLSIARPGDELGTKIAGISCWANVLRYGDSEDIHHHDPGLISAHYTVQSGLEEEPEPPNRDSGHTVYYRPGFMERSHGDQLIASPWDQDWRISRPACAGTMIFFPSYVRHEVRPHFGKTERISIALDIYAASQKAPFYFGGPRWFVPDQG